MRIHVNKTPGEPDVLLIVANDLADMEMLKGIVEKYKVMFSTAAGLVKTISFVLPTVTTQGIDPA